MLSGSLWAGVPEGSNRSKCRNRGVLIWGFIPCRDSNKSNLSWRRQSAAVTDCTGAPSRLLSLASRASKSIQEIWLSGFGAPRGKDLSNLKTDLALVCPEILTTCQPSAALIQEDTTMSGGEDEVGESVCHFVDTVRFTWVPAAPKISNVNRRGC